MNNTEDSDTHGNVGNADANTDKNAGASRKRSDSENGDVHDDGVASHVTEADTADATHAVERTHAAKRTRGRKKTANKTNKEKKDTDASPVASPADGGTDKGKSDAWRIAVVDDIDMLRDDLAMQIRAIIPDAAVEEYTDMNSIPALGRVDILLVDVELGNGHNGIDDVKNLLASNFHTQVIYVTGHAEYISSSYETRNVGFLLKPVRHDQLVNALRRAITRIESRRGHPIVIKVKGASHVISPARIIYVESSLRQCVFHLVDEESIQSYVRLQDLEDQLPPWFVRCHKSFLVNLAHVKTVETNKYVVRVAGEDVRIPISLSRREEAEEKFRKFMRGDYDIDGGYDV